MTTPVWHLLAEETREHTAYYDQHARHDLLSLPLRAPRLVLDVGCAGGATGRLIRERYPDAKLIGIEPDPAIAEIARQHFDWIEALTLDDFLQSPPSYAQDVDTVILGDVLEHMVNPWLALQKLRGILSGDAQLLVSLPNIRNIWLINELAQGRFSYEDSGLLDITHLRFFTRFEMERMFQETGYRVKNVGRMPHPAASRIMVSLGAGEIETTSVHVKGLSDQDKDELQTLQFLWLLEPVSNAAAIEPDVSSKSAPAGVSDDVENGLEQNEIYRQWILQRTLSPSRRSWMEASLQGWVNQPSIHLVMFVGEGQEGFVQETCYSVTAQIYKNWSLTLLSFASKPEALFLPPGCMWQVLGDDDDSLEVINNVLLSCDDDWVGVLYPGDRLPSESLFLMAHYARIKPALRWIYSDEDTLTTKQQRVAPLFKPDFNPELLRSRHYTGGLSLYARSVFAEVNGFDLQFEGVEDYDLALRLAAQLPEAAVGHIPEVLYHRAEQGRLMLLDGHECWQLAGVALQRHLQRLDWKGAVSLGPTPMSFQIKYEVKHNPTVWIVIPSRDHFEDLSRCVESIRSLTAYPNYQICIVDNQTVEADALGYLDLMRERSDTLVLKYDAPFNYSAMCNLAANQVESDYLLMLNNDVVVTQSDWLDRLLGMAEEAGVGVVGARLINEDGLIQHAGVVLGIDHKPAEHIFIGYKPEQGTVLDRLRLTQNYSAVTGACQLIRRSDYLAVGGQDATHLPTGYQDIDLCLKVNSQLGKRIAINAEVNLIHAGSKSFSSQVDSPGEQNKKRELYIAQEKIMFERWGKQIARDAAYNPNLTLGSRDANVEPDPVLTQSTIFQPKQKLLACPADHTGCGEYRIKAPMRALMRAGLLDGDITDRLYGPTEILRINPDVVVFQRQLENHQIDSIERYRNLSNAFLIYELDDVVTQSWHSEIDDKIRQHLNKTQKVIERALGLVDRFVASTPTIAEKYGHLCRETVIVPNYIPGDLWGALKPKRLQKPKPRVGWAGGASHAKDLELIAEVVKILHHEVEWVFFGLCPEALRPYVHEVHAGVPIDGYPLKLADLALDLALAPLVDDEFNRGRTALRVLEYGVLGYPVIASDMPSYREGGFPITIVGNNTDDWVSAIRELTKDRDALAHSGDVLRSCVLENWMLEDHLDVWKRAWLP